MFILFMCYHMFGKLFVAGEVGLLSSARRPDWGAPGLLGLLLQRLGGGRLPGVSRGQCLRRVV